MIELFEQNDITMDRHSSKGNQLKWYNDNVWYKADYMGYEGLAEYAVSHLLAKSSLSAEEYVVYESIEIKYKEALLRGVMSRNFLKKGEQLVTLEKLYKGFTGRSLYETIWTIPCEEDRLKFLVDEITRITGIDNFGEHLAKLITIDAFFLNEDRHMHNIAVIKDESGNYKACPVFDNGAALLSDTRMDYPLSSDLYADIKSSKSKTFSSDFDTQLDIVEKLYGRQMMFSFTKKDVDETIDRDAIYTQEERDRVKEILRQQMRKYQYLF